MRNLTRNDLIKIDDVRWEIPTSFHEEMNVPGRIFSSELLLDDLMDDRTLHQLINVTKMPGIVKAAMVMPDGHEGYGFPIGGVAAFNIEEGVISPGGIGYDINCGVRLLLSDTTFEEVQPLISAFIHELSRSVPKGMGRGGHIRLSDQDMKSVLIKGSEWAIETGYGDATDLDHTESNGKLPGANPDKVSAMAYKRGHDQLGTLGAGNHFIEVDRVDQILDPSIGKQFGFFPGQLVVLIHTGSRGLGHQIATDYLRMFLSRMPEYGLHLPDRELACMPVRSNEGEDYLSAMAAAANFAWCNRQVITSKTRQAWKSVTGKAEESLKLLYDVAHNIAKFEQHLVDGKLQNLIVHRKGATRAFGPDHPEIPSVFRDVGQPVLIPGSMGTCSYVLAGTSPDNNDAFGSSCHGAGRRLSRTAAKQQVHAPALKKELELQGITIEYGSYAGLAEEAPAAYKDVTEVVDTIHKAGLARKVVRLLPVGVIKG